MSVEWDYFDKFEEINNKYLPATGEGETKATQIVTAVCKLVYKWYNDGDVYDNTYHLEGGEIIFLLMRIGYTKIQQTSLHIFLIRFVIVMVIANMKIF